MKIKRPIKIMADVGIVPLTKGCEAIIDACDAALLMDYNWSVAKGYAASGGGKTRLLMHRVILGAGPGVFVDHVDGNKLNNRRANLRFATHAQNMSNRKIAKHNASGVKGVYWCPRESKWRAQIRCHGKMYRLGRFTDLDAAALAYAQASASLHGQFGRLK